MKYIHELKNWPEFTWDEARLAEKLAIVRHHQGRLIGRMEGLGFKFRAEAVLQSLTQEVILLFYCSFDCCSGIPRRLDNSSMVSGKVVPRSR